MAKRDAKAVAAEIASFAAEGQNVADLKASNLRLMRQLERAKARSADLVDAVYRAAVDGISTLTIPKVQVPKSDGRSKAHTPQVAVAVLSDWQLAKVTPTYNSEICEQRIGVYADKLERIVAYHRTATPIRELRVYLLGDIIEGELIFPGQAHLIDASLYRQVTIDGPRILSNFLRRMLTLFERVRVVAVIGNHGAIGGKARRDHNPTTNADRMLYRITQQLLQAEDRLTWVIPDRERERDWYAVDTIGKKSFLLFHGDQMRGGGHGGLPFYGFRRDINSWAAGALPETFDFALCGHWHQSTSLPMNFRILWVNGSTESFNTYAQEECKAMSAPNQWLLMAHPEHGVTAEYRVWLSSDPYGRSL